MHDVEWDNPVRSALFTDLYQLTMAQAYDVEGLDRESVFELFFRELPPTRNYIVAAGLDEILGYLEQLRFTDSDLAYLAEQGQFSDQFLERLRGFRFTGDVNAVPEGTPVFPNVPLVQVTAPILEAQLVETLILNQVHFQSLVATKAARVVWAAAGRNVVDFGSRRAHGCDAALKVARATYLVGGAGTSNVLAGKVYGVPIFGTMAHSYIQAHDDESAAFEAFAQLYPRTTLLVDTYDTLAGVQKMIELSREQGDRFNVRAVRLDSGNLAELAKRTRRLLDEAGLNGVQIFVSSGLDEYKVAELLAAGAPIDGFGVGTNLAVADDAAQLDMAYKLVEYDGRPRTKLSSEKIIYPGRKQVFRVVASGQMLRDVIGRFDEQLGQPLLQPVMRGGQRLAAGQVSLDEARRYAMRQLEQLPTHLQQLRGNDIPYPVQVSDALQGQLDTLLREMEAGG